MNSASIIETYIEDCEFRNLSPKTITGYVWALRRLTDTIELPETVAELKSTLMVEGVSDSTRQDLWRVVRTFYNWLEKEHGEPNLMQSVPKPRHRPRFPRTFSDDELQGIFRAAPNRRDKGMIAMLLDTGVRVGELAGLTWPMVSDGGILVDGKTGPRFVPTSVELQPLIEGLGDGHHVWIGRRGPLTLQGVMQAIRRTIYRAGLGPPKAGPHTLRHTFAKRFLRLGGQLPALQGLLGHASIESTMVYSRMIDTELIRQHQEFSPLRGIEV